jgi:hypothetical protein
MEMVDFYFELINLSSYSDYLQFQPMLETFLYMKTEQQAHLKIITAKLVSALRTKIVGLAQ